MSNERLSETQTLTSAVWALRERLPNSWGVEVIPERPSSVPGRPDAFLVITAPPGNKTVVAVETTSRIEPKDVTYVLERLRRYVDSRGDEDAALFVISPYLSPATRERLAARGAGYADATGNLRLVLEEPTLFIDVQGAESNPWPEERTLRSLRGPAAARLVRALVDFRPPYTLRDLAERSGTSVPSASRTVELLNREALVDKDTVGRQTLIADVDWRRLLERWVEDYSLTGSHDTRTFLEPRGFPRLLSALGQKASSGAETRYAVTGSLAASTFAPIAPSKLAVIYADDLDRLAKELDLRPADSGANVMLVQPFGDFVFDRPVNRDGVEYAAVSQVAADLMTSPGRGPQEAEALVKWMGKNENAWRA